MVEKVEFGIRLALPLPAVVGWMSTFSELKIFSELHLPHKYV